MNELERFEAWKRRPGQETLVVLLQDFQEPVYALCLGVLRHPQDAEDAAQRVFVELLGIVRRLETLDGLRAWIYRAALLTALNLKRGERRRRRYEHADRPDRASPLSEDDLEAIHEHVAGLQADLRSLVVRRYFERKTLAELAESAGCSTVAVWKKLEKARDTLRQSLLRAGLVSGAAAIAAFLESREVSAAPADLLSPALRSTSSAALTGGVVVKTNVAMILAGIALIALATLGVGVVRRSGSLSGDLDGSAARKGALSAQTARMPDPMIAAPVVRAEADEPVRTFRTGTEFLIAFGRSLMLREERDCCKALRRLGLRRSDEELRKSWLRTGMKRTVRSSSEEILRSLLADWMRETPDACASFINSLPFDWTMDATLVWTAGGAVVDWSKEDPNAALAFFARVRGDLKMCELRRGIELQIRFKEDPAAFLTWFRALPPSRAQEWEAMKLALPYWADQEPRSLVSWTEKLSDPQHKNILHVLARVWGDPSAAGSRWTEKCVEALETRKDFHAAVRAVVDEFLLGVAETDSEWSSENSARWETDLFRPLLLTLLGRQAEQDPTTAARYVESLPFDSWSISAIDSVATAWGRKDPRAALEWLKRRGFGSIHASAAGSIVSHWVAVEGFDPQEVLPVVESLPEGVRTQMKSRLLADWAQTDPAAAIRFAQSAPPGSIVPSPMPSIAATWSWSDPDAALGWARSLSPPSERDAAIVAIAGTLTYDVERALSAFAELTEESARKTAIEWWIGQAARVDRVGASKALELHPGAPMHVYTQVAQSYGMENPQEGLAWAASLSGERQTETRRVILTNWVSRKGPEPARQWVESSSLPATVKQELLRSLRKK
jgi:RNA polymerase sigma-70 factor (ECF subfamily)